MDDIINRLTKAVHDGDVRPGYIDPELLESLSKQFTSSLFGGFGKSLGSIDYDTPDYSTLSALRNNMSAFSAAKSYSQLKLMNELLLDVDGNRRSFREFEAEVKKLNIDYNVNWLETEYDTAHGNAQMAAQWNRYQANSEIPNITIRTAMDDRVRDEHQQYEGFTRPKNDPIWLEFFPPFGWKCRCDAEESFIPEYGSVDLNTIPTLFKNNPGASGIVFKAGHPYFKNMDDKITELTAVDNYGMKSANKLLSRSDLPKLITKPFDQQWSIKRTTYAYGSDSILVPESLGGKSELNAAIFNKSQYFHLCEEVMNASDEIWMGSKGNRVYIKYYDGKAIVIKTNATGKATSFDVLAADKVESLRKGVLMTKQ